MTTPDSELPALGCEPDFDQLLAVLRREEPARATFFEFFLNDDLYERLAGFAVDRQDPFECLRQLVAAYARAGYDYATAASFYMPFGFGAAQATKEGEASISLNHGAVISDEASLEAFAWPDASTCDYSMLERIAAHLPDGMKLMGMGPSGVLENTIKLVGFETLCFALMDQEDWVAEVFARVGACLVEHYRVVASYDTIGFCIANDDWGFRTQPMLTPDQLREHVFPWHRRIVDTVHATGKPIALHSCGNFSTIVEDIVDIGFDARHSYEDTILPVEDAYEAYHDRFAILGGIDVDFICRNEPEAVYLRSRAMLERSARRGGYALGTGNSVPDYVPQAGYLAMVRAGLDARMAMAGG
ncbi:MAG: hypothetical protein PF961_06030 [Planctomycetota bacterium]|nr:hypothetical protein [Planctomycetota bacterium]